MLWTSVSTLSPGLSIKSNWKKNAIVTEYTEYCVSQRPDTRFPSVVLSAWLKCSRASFFLPQWAQKLLRDMWSASFASLQCNCWTIEGWEFKLEQQMEGTLWYIKGGTEYICTAICVLDRICLWDMSGMKTVECLIFRMWFHQVFLELDTQVINVFGSSYVMATITA